MKVNAVIAEYNPFHKGHAYHIQKSKDLTGADYTVIIMSGSFVQRGEPALIDKFARTEMALSCGADLVLELPVCYAGASAEFFAGGAVSLLHALGCVDHLCFGSEAGDLAALSEIASVLLEEPESYRTYLKDFLSRGYTFPAAREQALAQSGCAHAEALSTPNNILAVEYLKALKRLKSSISPVTIIRSGCGYHDTELSGAYSSASALRRHFRSSDQIPDNVRAALPPSVSALLNKHLQKDFPVFANDFTPMLQYCLLTASDYRVFSGYFDVNEEIARRIFRFRYQFTDVDSFVSLIKTRNTTELSVRRALLHILLQIPSLSCLSEHFSGYGRILGFRKSASPLLKAIKEQGQLPLISKLADAPEIISSFESFDETKKKDALTLLNLDIRSSQIYQSIVSSKFQKEPYLEYQKQLVIL